MFISIMDNSKIVIIKKIMVFVVLVIFVFSDTCECKKSRSSTSKIVPDFKIVPYTVVPSAQRFSIPRKRIPKMSTYDLFPSTWPHFSNLHSPRSYLLWTPYSTPHAIMRKGNVMRPLYTQTGSASLRRSDDINTMMHTEPLMDMSGFTNTFSNSMFESDRFDQLESLFTINNFPLLGYKPIFGNSKYSVLNGHYNANVQTNYPFILSNPVGSNFL